MQTYLQEGDVLTLTAPYNVAAGGGVKVGGLVGIATSAALSGAAVEVAVEGCFTVPKNSAEAWTVGLLLYWDDDNKVFTLTNTTDTPAAHAIAVAANPSATGNVRLLCGPQGPSGATGAAGATGATGATGPTGATGGI